MTTLQPVKSTIVATLQSQLQPEVGFFMIFCKQVQNLGRNTVWTRANRQADHILNVQCFIIKGTQNVNRSKGVGKRLKIGHELTRLILAGHDLLALLNLCGDTQLAFYANRSGTTRVTEETTGARTTAIAIGATKTCVNGDFVDTATEAFFKVTGEKLIRLHRLNQRMHAAVGVIRKRAEHKKNQPARVSYSH